MENKQKLEIRAVVSKTCAQGPGDLLLCSSYFQSSLVTKVRQERAQLKSLQ